MNFNQCVKKYKSEIFFLGSKSLLRGHLFTWKEYLDHIKFTENYDWLTVLKVALEIYTGESKGFAKVPDEKETRELHLREYMKEMIKESVSSVIYKFQQSNQKKDEEEDKKSQNNPKQPRQSR